MLMQPAYAVHAVSTRGLSQAAVVCRARHLITAIGVIVATTSGGTASGIDCTSRRIVGSSSAKLGLTVHSLLSRVPSTIQPSHGFRSYFSVPRTKLLG